MEPASPARLYASLVGFLLVLAGILGFFYTASFGGLGETETALGVLQVNGWLNLLHIATGALGLLLAGVASRQYALAMGVLYATLAILGTSVGVDLALGLLGLAAAVGTPRPGRTRRSTVRRRRAKKPRQRAARSEARAQAAGKSA